MLKKEALKNTCKKGLLDNLKINRSSILKLSLILFLLASTLLTSDAFLFNPFYVPLLASSLLLNNIFFILVYAISITISFIKNLNYGFEISFIGIVFLLFTLIPFKTKNIFFNKSFSLTLTQLSFGTIYFVTSPTLESLITIIVSFFISIHFFYTIDKFFSFVEYYKKVDETTLFFLISYLSIIFYRYQYLSLSLIFISLIFLYSVNSDFKVRLSLLFVSLLILNYVTRIESYTIFILLSPFALVFLPKKKVYISIITFSPPILYALFFHNFYREELFYIVSFSAITSFLLIDYVNNIIYNPQQNTTPIFELNKNISLLKEYLSLLKDSCVRESISPQAKTELMLNKELCYKCDMCKNCTLKDEFISLLNTNITNEEKERITRICEYPNKFIYRLRTLKPIYERETIKSQLESVDKIAKEKEINRIIKPIDKLLEFKDDEKNYIDEISKKYTSIISINNIEKGLLIESNAKLSDDYLIETLSNIVHKPLTLESYEYSMLSHSYHYHFSYKTKYTIKIKAVSSAYNKISGDTYSSFIYSNNFHFILSDGMGHEDDSYLTSKYLTNVFKTTLMLNLNIDEVIDETNRLLKLKSSSEDYATLDYLKINLNTLNTTLYKFGSYISYLYRNSKLYELSKIMLPLGIIDDPDIDPLHFELSSNDIILLATDGINEITYPFLKSCFEESNNLDIILDRILNKAKENQSDDITIILLKPQEM